MARFVSRGPAGSLVCLSAVLTLVGCADPFASTLNQKCVFDTDCDDGQFCKKAPEEPAGLCNEEDSAPTSTSGPGATTDETASSSGTDSSSTTNPLSTTSTTDSTSVGPDTDAETETSTVGETDDDESSTGDPPVGCDAVEPDSLNWEASFLDGFNNPRSIATGDLNGDGNTDLVIAAQDAGTVTVMLGDGAGAFVVGSVTNLLAGPTEVAVGAIGDDTQDVLIGTGSDQQLYRYNGAGDGTIGNPLLVGRSTEELVLADFNNDGTLDVLTADGHDFVLALGGNNGAFQTQELYAGGSGVDANGVSAGHFNDDSFADAVLAHQSNEHLVFASYTGSELEEQGPYLIENEFPADVVAADFDGDGLDDVAVGMLSAGQQQVRIYTSNGDETFTAAGTTGLLTTTASAMEVADLEGDGDLDIVVSNGNVVTILYGDGGNGFVGTTSETCGANLTDVAIADLDGDCVLDIVATDPSGDRICVLLSTQ